MSTLKSIIFETLPDPEEYYETAEALRDLDRQYQHFTRTVWKSSCCNNNSRISEKDLRKLVRLAEANAELIKEAWVKYFDEIYYYC